MTYVPAPDRYDRIPYRRCGRSGIKLPEISLGLWQNFGSDRPLDDAASHHPPRVRPGCDPLRPREQLRRHSASDDPVELETRSPYGSAEINFGRIMREDLRAYRDELIISTKAGYDMWPGPYGDRGSRKYLLASLDQSLARMGLDYVDIFYSHRADPDTPLEETMGALATAVSSGRALYAGISSYSAERTARGGRDPAPARHAAAHPPAVLLDAQPLDRGRPAGHAGRARASAASRSRRWPRACSPASTWTGSRPARARARTARCRPISSPRTTWRTSGRSTRSPRERGQSLAQMALSWVLRDQRVTSALIGASSVAQLEENLAAAGQTGFSEEELAAIDRYAVEAGINIWADSSAVSATRRSAEP